MIGWKAAKSVLWSKEYEELKHAHVEHDTTMRGMSTSILIPKVDYLLPETNFSNTCITRNLYRGT